MLSLKTITPRPALAFAGFVFWLAAFPMAGPLLHGRGDLLCFLLPHTLVLLLLAGLTRSGALRALTASGVLATAGLTWAFPWFADSAEWLLPLLGVVSAPLSLRVVVSLKAAPSPLAAALFGLVVGNVLVAAVEVLPVGDGMSFGLVGLVLLTSLLFPIPRDAARGDAAGVLFYLPFVFVFQLVSGLMYGFLFPAYGEQALFPGSELLFYMGGATAAAALIRSHSDLTLAAGVTLAMVAFALLVFGGGAVSINLSMYAMMTAAGVIDLFLLGYVLSFDNAVRAYGLGGGVLCAGILAGHLLSAQVGEAGADIGLVGSLVLNLAVLTLFVLGQRRQKQALAEPSCPEPGEGNEPLLPRPLAARLSEQERLVLQKVLAEKTYKEVARDLQISESSVKTYMRRICQKSGASSKRQLMDRLSTGQR